MLALKLFEKTDRLVRFWLRYQFFSIILTYCSLIAAASFPVAVVPVILLGLMLIWTMAAIGISKTVVVRTIYYRGFRLLKGHTNRELVRTFRKLSWYLQMIVLIDVLLPISWMISYPLKYYFIRDLNRVKDLMDIPHLES